MTSAGTYQGIPRAARVRAARDLRGFTQGETVARMSTPISTAALSQIESAKVTPTARTLGELAEALSVPVEFFYAEWSEDASDDVLARVTYFRDLAVTPAKERRRAAARALLLSDLLTAIEHRVQLPRLSLPTYSAETGADRDEVEAIAQAVRGEWALRDEPIPHVVREIERHGVAVGRLSFGGTRVDAFSVRFDRRPLILLTDDKSNYVRSRFDAAHELGHLIMHRHADPSDRSIERQAHDFAASFLFPQDRALELLPRTLGPRDWARLADLKREWGVSMAALLFRARDLGMLHPDIYRNAMKYMSARGWRKAEPGDRQMGRPELPSLFATAMRTIQTEYDESDETVISSAHLPVADTLELLRAASDSRPGIHI